MKYLFLIILISGFCMIFVIGPATFPKLLERNEKGLRIYDTICMLCMAAGVFIMFKNMAAAIWQSRDAGFFAAMEKYMSPEFLVKDFPNIMYGAALFLFSMMSERRTQDYLQNMASEKEGNKKDEEAQ